jgi:hypothetical protein
MGEVIEADIPTTLDIPVERVLAQADRAKLEAAVVIGFLPNGDLFFGSSTGDAAEILWLLEVAKKKLMEE